MIRLPGSPTYSTSQNLFPKVVTMPTWSEQSRTGREAPGGVIHSFQRQEDMVIFLSLFFFFVCYLWFCSSFALFFFLFQVYIPWICSWYCLVVPGNVILGGILQLFSAVPFCVLVNTLHLLFCTRFFFFPSRRFLVYSLFCRYGRDFREISYSQQSENIILIIIKRKTWSSQRLRSHFSFLFECIFFPIGQHNMRQQL